MAEARHSVLDNALRAAVVAGGVSGVVAAVTDSHDVLYRHACGTAGRGLPMRADTVFRIASMTKLVTSLAVLMLRDEGRIDLDAPFGRYFHEFRQPPVLESFDRESLRYTTRSAARAITVRDLLTHTAGYGYWFLNPELRALLTGDPQYYDPPFLMHEPGTRFQYGVSTDVLGQLIAPVSGSQLAEFFSRRLFEPLGMRDTGFGVPRDESRLANVQVRREDGFIELPNEAAGESPRGGGGLYSTADDYLALLRLLLRSGEHNGRRLLAARSVRELASNQIGGLRAERQTTAAPERTCDFLFMDGTQQFGFGVLVETRVRQSGRSAGSYGWAGILNTYFWVDPAAGLAAVVLMQQSPFAADVCVDLCDAFELGVYRELTTLDRTKQ